MLVSPSWYKPGNPSVSNCFFFVKPVWRVLRNSSGSGGFMYENIMWNINSFIASVKTINFISYLPIDKSCIEFCWQFQFYENKIFVWHRLGYPI